MKECPKCKTVYTDKTLSFCLSDGSILIDEPTGAKTEVLPNGVVSPTVETQASAKTETSNQITDETIVKSIGAPKGAGVSPFWLLSTFALLGILLGGAIVAWVLYANSNREPTAQSGKNISISKTSNSDENKGSVVSATPEQTPAPTENHPAPKKTKSPAPSPTKSATPREKSYKVVGVKGGDVLYIRPSPGNLKVVVGKIPPGAKGIKVIGGGRKVGKSIWVPIVYNGKRGWVNRRFLKRQNAS